MTTDPRILALRQVARTHGWHVTGLRATRRGAARTDAARIYRPAWTPGTNMTHRDVWQHVEISIDPFDDEVIARVILDQRAIPTMSARGVEATEALLRKAVPQ